MSEGATARPWTAEMVGPGDDPGVGGRASFLRRSFRHDAVSGGETLRISAFGLYRAFLNGVRIGDDLLTPGWTCYDRRLSFQTYPVASLLRPGENVIDIWLGDGWYRSPLMWPGATVRNTWGDRVGAIAELQDGDRCLLVTDGAWQSGRLPILRSELYFGEIFDARLDTTEAPGGVVILPFDRSVLLAHETSPVREMAPLQPVQTSLDEEGRQIVDFGQNCAGYVALAVEGEAGACIIVEHAEILDRNGRFDRSSMRSAEARVEYRLGGTGIERFRPVFTFQGFRYARIAITGRARLREVTLVPITSVPEQRAGFSSANPLLDRLVVNTVWSQRSNFIEVPTDCPQRDERLGWTGDAQVFAATACYLADCESFLTKWLRDVMADQRPDGAIAHVTPDPTRMQPQSIANFFGSTGWGDAICVIPHVLHQHYGRTSILAETLPAMVRWCDYVWSISDGPIVRPPRDWTARGFTFGDWLQPSGPSVKPLPTIGDDAAATIYLCIAADLTARAARILGEEGIALRMETRAAAVRAAFAEEFVTGSGRLAYDDQTSYALAILHDLIPERHLPAARACFKATIARAEGRIGTGFIGTPALLPALVKIGETDLAARVLLQEGVPGWLYQVRMGATTIWERWDAIQPDGSTHPEGMNSFNHYAYGAVCQFLFERVAGFRPDPDRPGWDHVLFEPTILPTLSPVAAHHDSRAGRVSAAWTVEDGVVRYSVTVPEGATGSFILPPGGRDLSVDGRPCGMSPQKCVPLSPGAHELKFRFGDVKEEE